MNNMTARQYYKAMALNALIIAKQDAVDKGDCTQKDLIDDANVYADLMLEEDGQQDKKKAKVW